jgi:FHA domain
VTPSSYRPGAWFGIFGAHATVVLPPSEKARVSRIWALVDEGAGFDEVLDALISDGLRQLPGFVLVSDAEGETTVVIRGPARAEFTTRDETVAVEGSAVTTWQERSLRDVVSMRIDVADDPGEEDLAISEGLVRISRIDRPAVGLSPALDLDDSHPTGDDASPVVAALADETDYYPSAPVSPPSLPAAPVDDRTPTPAGNWDLAGLAGGGADLADEPVDADDLADGQPPVAVARLTFSSGDVVEVDRVVLVGRAPAASRIPATPEPPRLVSVPSPHQEISSTHVELRPGSGADLGLAVVTDLGSTNGTVLQQPGRPPEDLRPGVSVPVAFGAVIDLGDGVTILVEGA